MPEIKWALGGCYPLGAILTVPSHSMEYPIRKIVLSGSRHPHPTSAILACREMGLILCAVGLWVVSIASYTLLTLEQSQTGEKNLGVAVLTMMFVRIMVASAIGGCVCITISFVRWLRRD